MFTSHSSSLAFLEQPSTGAARLAVLSHVCQTSSEFHLTTTPSIRLPGMFSTALFFLSQTKALLFSCLKTSLIPPPRY